MSSKSFYIPLSDLYKIGMPVRGIPFLTKARVTAHQNGNFTLKYLPNIFAKIGALLLFPILLVWIGIKDFRVFLSFYKETLFPTKYGSWGADKVEAKEPIAAFLKAHTPPAILESFKNDQTT